MGLVHVVDIIRAFVINAVTVTAEEIYMSNLLSLKKETIEGVATR